MKIDDSSGTDWSLAESSDNDFRVMLPKDWKIIREDEPDCSLIAYKGVEDGVNYIVQRVNYSPMLKEIEDGLVLTPKIRNEILNARVRGFVDMQGGKLTSSRQTTFLGLDAIDFKATCSESNMEGTVLWLNGCTYSIITLQPPGSITQFIYFKMSFYLDQTSKYIKGESI